MTLLKNQLMVVPSKGKETPTVTNTLVNADNSTTVSNSNNSVTQNSVTQNSITQNIAQQTIVNIHPFSMDQVIILPAEMIQAAFTENAKLREYCASGNIHLDAEKSAPYVLEALVELVRRAHSDPAQRNIYLSPDRADQVRVFMQPNNGVKGTWELLPLIDAIRRTFDSVSKLILRANTTEAERKKMSFEVQSVTGWVRCTISMTQRLM